MTADRHRYRISGRRSLTGAVEVSGAKNSVTKSLVATLQAYLLVVVMGAVTTIIAMLAMIERLCGVPADSEGFFNTSEKQLRLIIGHTSDTRTT
jgi:UDP-N-acetylglucosamine enolpyruvyl transferase